MEDQLKIDKFHYLNNLDFKDLIRYYSLLKDIVEYDSKDILDLGTGSSVLNQLIRIKADSMVTVDFNDKLKPDIVADVRELIPQCIDKFDTVVASEILEHIPFHEVTTVVSNIYQYLKSNGKAFITIPHRNPYISFTSILNTKKLITIIIPRYRKIKPIKEIDIHHEWEIGNGYYTKEVEFIFKRNGFKILKYENIPHHDYWVLEK